MSKIGIIDADLIDHGTRHPNLALMKIAGYFKEKGDDVSLIYKSYDEIHSGNFDKIYLACVFNFTKIPKWVLNLPNIVYGGTGLFEDGGKNLPNYIEHHMPYYDLYLPYVEEQFKSGKKKGHFDDYLYYSIGFTTRGCFRKCSFCVNKKYDHAFIHSPVKEFLDESKPYIYLWDDNILAYPGWKNIIKSLEETGKPFQFRQGIDLRLMTDEIADTLLHVKYHGDFIFAFDHIEDKDLIVEKVQLWKRHTPRICKMYVIVAYNSQDENDIIDVFERIHTLMIYGSLPYIMRYEKYRLSPYKEIYIQLARWCNQPQFFKKMSFREFCIANQKYKKNKETNCSAYQSMLDFENKFPKIANKYFDLKFEDENIYKEQYGYGRRYANKPLCKFCKINKINWDYLKSNPLELCIKFLTKEIDLGCLDYRNKECQLTSVEAAAIILDALKNTPVKLLLEKFKEIDKNRLENVTPENIPQFSNNDYTFKILLSTLIHCTDGCTFDRLGYLINREGKNSIAAKRKYGENHAKLVAQLGLAKVLYTNRRSTVKITTLGKLFYNLDDAAKKDIFIKLCLRVPIIRDQILSNHNSGILIKEFSVLSKKTQIRRGSNLRSVLKYIREYLNM
jgi:hypothetical protein